MKCDDFFRRFTCQEWKTKHSDSQSVSGSYNAEEESITKIKHIPPNMENLKEVIDDSEHFTFCVSSETKHYIFLNILQSIWTTHLDLNDLIWRTLETLKTRHTHGLQQNYTDKARTDNASRDYVDYNRSAGI